METQSDNKRLAKNTLILYLRTLLMMLIGFYTSRVIINALGIENYGINDVVAGFIAMFSVIQTTMTNATSRFMTCELGKGESGEPRTIFGVAMTIHIILAIFMVILLESVGLFFLNNGLKIPDSRMWAANWVFHFSVLYMALSILNSPYIGLIIAHERMDAFAFMSMFDVCIKLGIVFLLFVTPYDKLISYSVFYLITGILCIALYNIYSRRHFPESKYKFVNDKQKYKEIFNFAGINFLGGLASMLSTHGVNILINLFYGVTLNAAMGVANQVKGLSTKFVDDFIVALKPQITKEYAAGNIHRSMDLTFRGSKFSFFLALILAVPIITRTQYILEIWLKIFPPEAVLFSRLTVILTMLVLLSDSLVTEALASGKVKELNLWVGTTRMMIIPIAYFALKLTNLAYMVLVVQIVMELISLYLRLLTLNHITGINHVLFFTKQVGVRISVVSLLAGVIAFLCNIYIPDNFIGLCLVCFITMSITCLFILYLGLSKGERSTVLTTVGSKLNKLFKRSPQC